ncbi:hypothetical protein SFC55_24870 [Niallia taxi]|uniref:hypothetical protein n=1 Tax=Niallia taxi TaxID=2499688 RepID=UPI003981B593
MNEKSYFIDLFDAAVEVGAKSNGQDVAGFLTYITSNGVVCGRISEVQGYDVSSNESIYEGLKNYMKEEEGADPYSLANAYFYNNYKENKNIINPAIPLEDVQILFSDGLTIEVNEYILFTDQVIGILPRKNDLNNFKLDSN